MGSKRQSKEDEEDFTIYEKYGDLESVDDDIKVNIAGLHRLGFKDSEINELRDPNHKELDDAINAERAIITSNWENNK